jgi:hypothetical protein
MYCISFLARRNCLLCSLVGVYQDFGPTLLHLQGILHVDTRSDKPGDHNPNLHCRETSNLMKVQRHRAEAVTLLTCIREIPGSNLDRNTGCPD